MKLKKLKIWQIIVIIVLIIILLFAVNVARKMFILSSIQQKIIERESTLSNCYVQKTFTGEDIDYTNIDIYYKDGNQKIITNLVGGNSIIQFVYPTEEKIFMNIGEERIYSTNKSSTKVPMLESAVNEVTLKDGLKLSIGTEEVEGKECYVIKGKISGWAYENNVKDLITYVEKDTGITVKRVEVLEDGKERVTLIKTIFNEVTDEDMQEPNMEEYQTNGN